MKTSLIKSRNSAAERKAVRNKHYLSAKFVIGSIVGSTILSFASLAHHESTMEHIDLDKRIAMSQKTEEFRVKPPVVSISEQAIPSDAIPLFADGLQAWQKAFPIYRADGEKNENQPTESAQWRYQDGVVTVVPGTGDIRTKQAFCDVQIHLEWKVPQPDPAMTGQQRNNSGIFIQERYEVQILDSYANETYGNGQAGAIYKQKPPLVNAMKAPEQWQSYDIIYRAPKFDGLTRISAGSITVLHNGVLIQDHYQVVGTTEWIGPPQVDPHGCAPIKLQDHGNLVSFRNMWVREI